MLLDQLWYHPSYSEPFPFFLVSHYLFPPLALALALLSLVVSQIDPGIAVLGACIIQKSVFRETVLAESHSEDFDWLVWTIYMINFLFWS